MDIFNDDKPRILINEYELCGNLPKNQTILDDRWSTSFFLEKFRVKIVRAEDMELEFDLIGIHPSFANAFRRIMLSEVPSMAIEKVYVYNNTSILQDEVLAHRLGLIPLRADPRLFEWKADSNTENTETDTLEFSLKIRCNHIKNANPESSRVEDIYKNTKVYSKDITWEPIGDQRERFTAENVGPVENDILIAKLRPGHELDLKLTAVKGIGSDHAKFSPVCTAFYRMHPDIRLLKEVYGEAAERLASCFSPRVFKVETDESGRKRAVLFNARYDMGSRNVFQYEDLKNSVALSKICDHFIFTVQSVGAMKPEDIFVEAVKILKQKCKGLLSELAT